MKSALFNAQAASRASCCCCWAHSSRQTWPGGYSRWKHTRDCLYELQCLQWDDITALTAPHLQEQCILLLRSWCHEPLKYVLQVQSYGSVTLTQLPKQKHDPYRTPPSNYVQLLQHIVRSRKVDKLSSLVRQYGLKFDAVHVAAAMSVLPKLYSQVESVSGLRPSEVRQKRQVPQRLLEQLQVGPSGRVTSRHSGCNLQAGLQHICEQPAGHLSCVSLVHAGRPCQHQCLSGLAVRMLLRYPHVPGGWWSPLSFHTLTAAGVKNAVYRLLTTSSAVCWCLLSWCSGWPTSK